MFGVITWISSEIALRAAFLESALVSDWGVTSMTSNSFLLGHFDEDKDCLMGTIWLEGGDEGSGVGFGLEV